MWYPKPNMEGAMKDLSTGGEGHVPACGKSEATGSEQKRPSDFGMMMRRPEDLERTPNTYKDRLEN